MSGRKYCGKCGTPLPKKQSAGFCSNCGADISGADQQGQLSELKRKYAPVPGTSNLIPDFFRFGIANYCNNFLFRGVFYFFMISLFK